MDLPVCKNHNKYRHGMCFRASSVFVLSILFWFPQCTHYFAFKDVSTKNSSMPTGFFIWGYMYPFTFIFGGAMYPSNSLHLGVQRKLTAFSPRKVVHHAVFCKYYAELTKTFFFCLTLGQTGSVVLSDPWPLCLSTTFL